MGGCCFTNCFGKSKRHQRRSSRKHIVVNKPPCLLQHLQNYESIDDFQVSHLIEEEPETVKSTKPSPDSREKANSSERKKVTFNLDVKIYEDLSIEDQDQDQEGGERKEEEDDETQSPSNSSSSSLFSYPSNHRYQNCRDSDDELDEVMSSDDDDDDFSDDDEDYEGDELDKEAMNENPSIVSQEQSSESLFSLNIVTEVGDKEVNSPLPIKNPPLNDSNPSSRYDRTKYIDSVLNPVENMTQWKVIKARSKLATKNQQAKENLSITQDLNNIGVVRKERFGKGVEIGVDTSLSSWLVGSEVATTTTTPNSKTSSVSVGNSASERMTISPNKFEDRPILGALTVEEIRTFSASQSPRKSPCRSPDEMPIIGSVGSYWSHTGQGSGSSTKSKSRLTESTKVIWNSTPFETRLEKALEQDGVGGHQVL